MTVPDLAALQGVRSGKQSYYREFRRSSERLEAAVRSLDAISVALVHTVEGPRALLTAVLHAAAEHLSARWTLFAIADRALPGARPRFLAVDAAGRLIDTDEGLDEAQRQWLKRLRADSPAAAEVTDDGVVVVPMTIDGEPVGGIAGRPGPGLQPEALDVAVLRILVNQAAVALHTADLYSAGVALQTRAEQLTQEAWRHAQDLAVRSRELHSAQELLVAARQRELLDGERHRIARELHDSVTQHVLSAGMMIEVCRAETESAGPESAALTGRLAEAKGLTQRAVGQLRSAIYALHHAGDAETPLLPRLVEDACRLREGDDLAVDLRIEGSPVAISPAAEESLSRLAGEAVFNARLHARAARCVVRLSYRRDELRLTVDDDGTGDPATLRSMLRIEQAGDVDGRRRGLANMAARATELGGTYALRRSRLGGVRTEVRVPLPLPGRAEGPE